MTHFIDAGANPRLRLALGGSRCQEMCTRVCVLSEGRKVFDGDVAEGLALYHSMENGHATTGSP